MSAPRRAFCSECGKSVAIKRNGTLFRHYADAFAPHICPGSLVPARRLPARPDGEADPEGGPQ